MKEDFCVPIFLAIVGGILVWYGLIPLSILAWCVGIICFIVAKIEEYKFQKYAEELRKK